MNIEAEFNKCPSFDGDLKAWSNLYPEIKDVFFGDAREYNIFVYTIANLKNIDKTDNSIIEYGFSEDEIKTIAESYKEDNWNQSIDGITEDVKTFRASADKENSFINNRVREWKAYEVPAVEKGNYYINNSGIFRVVETFNETTGQNQFVTKDVCRSPFVICGISEPLTDDSIYYKVRYATYDGAIREFWASTSSLLSRTELKTVFLARGINCPENTLLMETVEYISRCIGEFGSRFKKEFSAKRNGWNEDKTIFVVGNRAITAKGIEPVLSVGAGKGFPELDKKGTVSGWCEGVKPFFEYDLIRFKFYDAFTAPLKARLGVESHSTDHYGTTSCGKTLSAWIALSGIGDAEGLTIGAKSTAKGILVHVRDFSDLPILIDESSDAGEHLADLVYPLTSNKGRVKSTVTGERDGGEEYHTSTMFTGERPIRDCLTNSGQQYRVNELNDTLPDLPTVEIDNVKRAIRENHGHIIELYLSEVFKRIENGSLYNLYENCLDTMPENKSNIEGRSRSIFACIMTAGKILEPIFEKLGLPKRNAVNIVNKYFKLCIQDNPVELEYIRALRVVLDWVHSDFGRFAEVNPLYDEVTLRDQNKKYGYTDHDYIDIIGTEFTKKMKEEGFSPSKIKEDWWNQGIIGSNDKDRPGTYRINRHNIKTFVGVRINRVIAEELIGFNPIEDTTTVSDIPQDKIIRLIIKTIALLTEAKGEADIQLIRQIITVTELDDLLYILSRNGKILKISQTVYKNS